MMPEFKLDEPVTYAPVGKCIYCGTDQRPLRREHIIPYGLGGRHILPDASCSECENITKNFEGDCQRRMMGNFRMTANLPSRRRKERPRKIATIIRWGDDAQQMEEREIPIEDYPVGLTLLIFEPPGLVAGRSPTIVIKARPFLWRRERVLTDSLGAAWFSTGGVQPLIFGKMLCKIAHSYATARLGINVFAPLVVPVIKGEMEEFTHYVGSLPEIPTPSNEMHSLYLDEFVHNDTRYIQVGIRLFCRIGTPVYQVIVGSL